MSSARGIDRARNCLSPSKYVRISPIHKRTVPPAHAPHRIDPPTRIRRAIHLNDLVLLRRIVKNNPQHLQNPDFNDDGNTSLHLAAKLGLYDIAVRSALPPKEKEPIVLRLNG